MDLFLAICQGLGLALAIGIGGALAALFASMMASLEAGFDPEGTDFDFVTATWFLVTLLALVVLAILARGREAARVPIDRAARARPGRSSSPPRSPRRGRPPGPGLIVGALATAAAAIVAFDVLEGAMARARSKGPTRRPPTPRTP